MRSRKEVKKEPAGPPPITATREPDSNRGPEGFPRWTLPLNYRPLRDCSILPLTGAAGTAKRRHLQSAIGSVPHFRFPLTGSAPAESAHSVNVETSSSNS